MEICYLILPTKVCIRAANSIEFYSSLGSSSNYFNKSEFKFKFSNLFIYEFKFEFDENIFFEFEFEFKQMNI